MGHAEGCDADLDTFPCDVEPTANASVPCPCGMVRRQHEDGDGSGCQCFDGYVYDEEADPPRCVPINGTSLAIWLILIFFVVGVGSLFLVHRTSRSSRRG